MQAADEKLKGDRQCERGANRPKKEQKYRRDKVVKAQRTQKR